MKKIKLLLSIGLLIACCLNVFGEEKSTIEVKIEPRETYFEINTIRINNVIPIKAIIQFVAKQIPPRQATDFPPLKEKKHGNVCPIHEAKPAI